VNETPGLQQHYQVADAAGATPVCMPVLRALAEPGYCCIR
jgi:hypothetical protein